MQAIAPVMPAGAPVSVPSAAAVRDAIRRAGSAVRAPACRPSLCRIAVFHDDPEPFEPAAGAAPALLQREVQGFVTADGGRPETVIYLAREGQSLPAFTAQN